MFYVFVDKDSVRLKVWEGVDEPPQEVKHLLCDVPLSDTSDPNCVAWLCHRPDSLCNGDIIMPTCPYDLRIKLRSGMTQLQSLRSRGQGSIVSPPPLYPWNINYGWRFLLFIDDFRFFWVVAVTQYQIHILFAFSTKFTACTAVGFGYCSLLRRLL